jgi:hypothetical protein
MSSKNFYEGMRFCPRCNYAVSKLEVDSVRYNYWCPRCDEAKLGEFYAYGSLTHRDIHNGRYRQPATALRPPILIEEEDNNE